MVLLLHKYLSTAYMFVKIHCKVVVSALSCASVHVPFSIGSVCPVNFIQIWFIVWVNYANMLFQFVYLRSQENDLFLCRNVVL